MKLSARLCYELCKIPGTVFFRSEKKSLCRTYIIITIVKIAIYEILAEYPAFQSGDECLIIKFILMNRHHKETLAKCYKSCNIVIPRPIRHAIRQAHGPEQRRGTHGPEYCRRVDRGIQCFERLSGFRSEEHTSE